MLLSHNIIVVVGRNFGGDDYVCDILWDGFIAVFPLPNPFGCIY